MIKRHQIYFLGCMAILFWAYNYTPVLSFRPRSIHQWAQCDRASLALNYYKENRSFFSPSLNAIGGDGTGQGVSEMPLIQYSVAQVWKIFGFHEWMYRLIELIFLFTGLYYLLLLFRLLLKNDFLSIIGTVLIFTSPALVFYGNNFLSEVPAFSFVIIGWYYFFRFYESGKKFHLGLSMFCFLLSGWLKISSLMSVAAISGIFILELVPKIKFGKNGKLFPDRRFILACFGILFIGIFSWYRFAIQYNHNHINETFLTQILPIWNCAEWEIKMILNGFYIHVMRNFFHPALLGILLVSFIWIVTIARKSNALMTYLSVSLFIGIVADFLLFFENFKFHDYYLIQLIIAPVFILASLFMALQQKAPRIISSKVFSAALSLFTIFQVAYASTQMSGRYFISKKIKPYYFISADEAERMRWTRSDYESRIKAFETIEPYNRSLGILREDRVISIPDESANVTLYLMDQKGFTIPNLYGINHESLKHMIVDRDAKYIFISDPTMLQVEELKPFLKNKIGNYENIEIYQVDKSLLN